MAKDLQEFRGKLIDKIQQADSDAAIVRLIETALRTLSSKGLNGHLVARFLDKTIVDLTKYNEDEEIKSPLNRNSLQAKDKLLELRIELTEQAISPK